MTALSLYAFFSNIFKTRLFNLPSSVALRGVNLYLKVANTQAYSIKL